MSDDAYDKWDEYFGDGAIHSQEWIEEEERLADMAKSNSGKQTAVSTCVICHFPVELDDIVVSNNKGCVCLRCYGNETGSYKQMPKDLRRDLTIVLHGV